MTDEPVRPLPGGHPRIRVTPIRRPPKPKRESSNIAFPYVDQDGAISVARAIIDAGGVPVTRDQLAATMNLAMGSGNFMQKVAAARLFGIVDYVAGKYQLTDLGFLIVDKDEKNQREARRNSFLGVPLYRRAYDEFRGKQLPPRPHGLENAFVKFGVAQKQKAIARLVFDKSAAQAGFFPNGQDRLVEPIIGVVSSPDRGRPAEQSDVNADRFAAVMEAGVRAPIVQTEPDLHPFIQGLLNTLPEPETNWTVDGRAKWLRTAANIFDLIYKGSGDITIVAEVAKSETQK